MTYRQFLQNFKYKFNKKIVLVKGGSAYVRDDVLLLLKRRVSRDKLLVMSSAHIGDVWTNTDVLLYDSPKNFRIIYWEDFPVVKKEARDLLKGMADAKAFFVLVDPNAVLEEIFTQLYPKGSIGMVIDCSPQTKELAKLVKARLNLVSGIKVDDDVLRYLAKEVPYDILFDVFHSVEAIRLDNLSMDAVKRYGLSKVDLEGWVCDRLLKLGRKSILKYDLLGLDARKFLRFLVYRLTLLIQVSTLRKGRPLKNAQSLDLPLEAYFEFVNLAKKHSLKDLYRRFYLTYSLMKWQEQPGALLLLLMYW